MSQKIRQIIILILVLFMIFVSVLPAFALTESEYAEFQKNEEHYSNICKSYTSDNAQTCQSYKTYLEEKAEKASKNAAKYAKSINDIKNNLSEYEKENQNYHNQLDEIKKEMTVINNEITTTEAQIEQTVQKIKERKEKIEELDILVKSYLVNQQSDMRVNGLIEFIMGASSFSEIMRRGEGMKRIKEYNEEIINELAAEREKLEADQKELEYKKEMLEAEKDLLQEREKEAQQLKAIVETLIKELHKQKAEQEVLKEQEVKLSETEKKRLKEITEAPKPSLPPPSSGGGSTSNGSSAGQSGGSSSSGWLYPVNGKFSISAGVWNYPAQYGGGKHLGLDFAGSIGLPIIAPGNGVVLRTEGGCATWGGFPGYCNGGWGNYVNLIVNIGGTYYGLLFAHLQAGSFTVSSGQSVSAGQMLGRMGSSGSSTGPHLHAEVYYLGNDYFAAVNYYTSNTFGTGSSSYGNEYSHRCDVNGYSAPCRMNPYNVW